MAQKNSDINGVNSADHELYLECLGQLVGITFKPGTNLRETERVSQQQFDLAKAETDTYVASNISIEKAKQWKPGALTACLRRLGIDPDGKKVTCSDPLKPTAKEILPSFVFPHTEVSHCENICSTSGFNPKRVFSGKQNKDSIILGNKKRIEGNPKNPNDASNHFQNKKLFSSITAPPVFTQNSNLNQGQHYSNKKPTSADTANAIPDEDMEGVENIPNSFQTARTVLMIQDKEKGVKRSLQSDEPRKRGGLYKSDIIKARKTFVENVQKSESKTINHERQEKVLDGETDLNDADPELVELLSHPQMKNFEVKIVESIWSEVMQPPQVTNWSDIAGLEGPKRIINEIIIWPMLRPEIFHGLRAPAKGILLFGPPGTGKTMIGRVIASVSKSTFFNISASSLTSKWIGEGEKLVRCLFQLARLKQPSVVFIDEIDSILTSRSDTEHESSRRIKTEFLVQFDGCGTTSEDRVLVIGVTNRPQELDEAARRRLVKRIYIPLPDIQGRIQMVKNLMAGQQSSLTEEDYKVVGEKSQGFSGADMKSLCQDASYGPIREIMDELETITPDRVRGIEVKDFLQAFKQVKSSVADTDLVLYEEWDSRFGSHAGDR